MSNPAKDIRKQVRNVTQEILSDVLNNELVTAMEVRIMTYVKKRLDAIDERQKDIQAYMIRNSAPQMPSVKAPKDKEEITTKPE